MSAIVEHLLEIAGCTCRLRVAGEGPHALVLFPAVMDSAVAFGRVQLLMKRKLLHDEIATVAVDPPGYGTHEDTPSFDAWPAFCEQLVRELQGLFSGRLVFAGNSSGAVAATEGALYAERTSGLAWICWCDWRQRAPRSHDLLCPRDDHALDRLLAHAWHRPPALTEASRASMLLEAMRNRAHVASFDAAKHREHLSRYRGPLMVVAGEADRLVEPSDARAAALAHPRSRFELIAESGHYPHREQPSVLAAMLAQFAVQCIRPDTPRKGHAVEEEHAVGADQ